MQGQEGGQERHGRSGYMKGLGLASVDAVDRHASKEEDCGGLSRPPMGFFPV